MKNDAAGVGGAIIGYGLVSQKLNTRQFALLGSGKADAAKNGTMRECSSFNFQEFKADVSTEIALGEKYITLEAKFGDMIAPLLDGSPVQLATIVRGALELDADRAYAKKTSANAPHAQIANVFRAFANEVIDSIVRFIEKKQD